MKKMIFSLLTFLSASMAIAQDYIPTVNWPYLLPDFCEGELRITDNVVSRSRFNIHLGQGILHMVDENGIIVEISVDNALSARIGDDEYANIGGKMLRVLARSDNGYVVEEKLADYSAVVRDDGAYGGSLSNAAKGFSYDENYGNYAYLITNVYDDLYYQKEYGEELPVVERVYLIINGEEILASKKDVSGLEGIDKKAFTAFLKEKKINWKNPDDLLKVIEFITKLPLQISVGQGRVKIMKE